MPREKFIADIQLQDAVVPMMPLAHTTSAGTLYEILVSNAIEPRHTFLGKLVIYFFYGINFYKQSSSYNDHLSKPIGFLLGTDVLKDADSVFPFDTGAFSAGLYGDYLEEEIEKYMVPMSSSDIPGKMVKLLFDSNESYLTGLPKQEPQAKSATEFRLRSFLTDATTKIDKSNFDDRCYGIEVQFLKKQRFKESVELLILPRNSYNRHLKGMFEDYLGGINIEFYDDFPLSGPKADSTQIKQKAIEYLRSNGVLE